MCESRLLQSRRCGISISRHARLRRRGRTLAGQSTAPYSHQHHLVNIKLPLLATKSLAGSAFSSALLTSTMLTNEWHRLVSSSSLSHVPSPTAASRSSWTSQATAGIYSVAANEAAVRLAGEWASATANKTRLSTRAAAVWLRKTDGVWSIPFRGLFRQRTPNVASSW
jgi:hypothetical protein